MATFVARNSGGVKKKKKEKEANDNLERVYLYFVLVSTSGASEDSLEISLTPKRSEFTGVQKRFLLWREIGDKIDHYISYRVFSV